MKIEIEIETCKQCPHFKITGTSTTDGFDSGDDWFCKKANREIAGFVEWHEKPKIPLWCPCDTKNRTLLTHVIDNNGTVIKKMAWAGEAVGVYDEDNKHYPIGIEKNGDFIIEEVWTHNEAMLQGFYETSYEKNTPILLPIKAGDKWDGKTMQYWPVEHENMMYDFFGSNGFGNYRSKPNSIGYQIHMIQMYDRMIDGGSLVFGGLDGWIKHRGSAIALFTGLHQEFGFPLFEFKDERAAYRQKMFIRFFKVSKKHFEELLKIESL